MAKLGAERGTRVTGIQVKEAGEKGPCARSEEGPAPLLEGRDVALSASGQPRVHSRCLVKMLR